MYGFTVMLSVVFNLKILIRLGMYEGSLIQINQRNPLGNLESIIQNLQSISHLFQKQVTSKGHFPILDFFQKVKETIQS